MARTKPRKEAKRKRNQPPGSPPDEGDFGPLGKERPGSVDVGPVGKKQRVDAPKTPVKEASARGYMSGGPKKVTQPLPNDSASIQGKNRKRKGNSDDDTIPPVQKRHKGEGTQSTSDEIGTPIEQPSINEPKLEIEALRDQMTKMKEELQEVPKMKEQLQILQALLESRP